MTANVEGLDKVGGIQARSHHEDCRPHSSKRIEFEKDGRQLKSGGIISWWVC